MSWNPNLLWLVCLVALGSTLNMFWKISTRPQSNPLSTLYFSAQDITCYAQQIHLGRLVLQLPCISHLEMSSESHATSRFTVLAPPHPYKLRNVWLNSCQQNYERMGVSVVFELVQFLSSLGEENETNISRVPLELKLGRRSAQLVLRHFVVFFCFFWALCFVFVFVVSFLMHHTSPSQTQLQRRGALLFQV